jgi:hypothetical protein
MGRRATQRAQGRILYTFIFTTNEYDRYHNKVTAKPCTLLVRRSDRSTHVGVQNVWECAESVCGCVVCV